MIFAATREGAALCQFFLSLKPFSFLVFSFSLFVSIVLLSSLSFYLFIYLFVISSCPKKISLFFSF